MTRAGGSAGSIRTPSEEGEYRIYVLDREGKVLSKSSHILRIKGMGGNDSNVIEAENYDYKSGIDIENCSEGGSDVGYIENGDYIGFKDIDLTGADKIDFRVASNGSDAVLEVRLDSPDGKLIGSTDVTNTGGWQEWITKTCNIEATSGKHDVYLVFTGGESYLFNLNWWKPNTPAEEYILGDLNGDGIVDIFDLCSMRNAAVDGDAERFEAADINGDGSIDENDLVLLKKFLSGEIKAFV